MAKKKKASGVVDGFTALKAVREAQTKDAPTTAAKPRARTDPAERKRKPSDGLPGASKTALPTKHRIRCYECEYDFTVTGRVTNTGCPKCHTTLEARDHTINEEWRDDLKTIGAIRIGEEGVIKGGDLFARDIVVEGGIEDGKIYACGCLDLHPKAKLDINAVDARDLVIRPGGRFASTRVLRFRNIEIGGELNAKLRAEGLVKVLSGGYLRGSVRGTHLEVEEGGGLKAKIEIHGTGADEEKEA